ncbi:MAG: hypothetical protein K2K60_03110 [Clostridia bacterium]|nr:hypothetical protein [Clostridia bacterium]
MDILNYIDKRQSSFLKSVNYRIGDAGKRKKEAKLEYTDKIEVNLNEKKSIEVIFTRELHFVPDSSFKISVSMGSLLYFNEKEIDNLELDKIDIVEEIKNCPPIINKLISRTSLLISQLTSSFGSHPVITPPVFVENKESTQ